MLSIRQLQLRFADGQKLFQGKQRREGRPRRADLEAGTPHRIELPGGNHRDDAGCQLDVRDLAGGAPLTQYAMHLPTVKRVPAIVDDDILPDMGTMTPRLL